MKAEFAQLERTVGDKVNDLATTVQKGIERLEKEVSRLEAEVQKVEAKSTQAFGDALYAAMAATTIQHLSKYDAKVWEEAREHTFKQWQREGVPALGHRKGSLLDVNNDAGEVEKSAALTTE